MDHEKKKKRNKKKKKQQKIKGTEPSFGGYGERETDYSSSSSSVSLTVPSKGYDPFQIQAPEDAFLQNDVSEQNVNLAQHSHRPPSGMPEPVSFETETQKWLQREAILEDTIKHLQNENHSLIQRESTLEHMAKQLQDEVYSHEQKEASLEAELVELQAEKDSWVKKEVVESEQSRKSVLQEKQKLVEHISDMQLHIQNLERTIASGHSSSEICEHGDLKSDLEGAQALVTKLISENTELVEKVNELYAELGQKTTAVGFSSGIINDWKVKTAEIVPDPISASGKKPESYELKPVKNETFGNDNARADLNSPQPYESGEIEPFPFDDNETVGFGKTSENALLPNPADSLPLSDAPLIGAPFRLISMVASYVSGDDLLNKSPSDSTNSSEVGEVEVDNTISQQYVN